MANFKNFFDKFSNLNGASFIGITNYESVKSGEIAHYTVNVNIGIETAKKKDFQTLQSVTDTDVNNMVKQTNFDVETVKLALSEMIASAEKNLSANLNERSKQSQGQTDAYVPVAKGVKLHKETMQLHIFGMIQSKKVVPNCEGTFKQVKSADKTLAKKAWTKYLNLRAGKFRNFVVNSLDSIQITGDTVTVK